MNRDLDELLAGKTPGLRAALLRVVLHVAAVFYKLGVSVRNGAYDRGWKTIQRAAIPVVSLGNLTTGGTGKTPFAAFVARWYRERGVRVCFVSRGYRARGSSDWRPS